MGRTKELFMEMREYMANMENELTNGEIEAIEFARQMYDIKTDAELIVEEAKQANLNNIHSILADADKYGKQGYQGLLFTPQSKTTFDFKNISKWNTLKADMKDIEDKAKTAYKMSLQGQVLIDEQTGEQVELPEVKVSETFLKIDKVK